MKENLMLEQFLTLKIESCFVIFYFKSYKEKHAENSRNKTKKRKIINKYLGLIKSTST